MMVAIVEHLDGSALFSKTSDGEDLFYVFGHAIDPKTKRAGILDRFDTHCFESGLDEGNE